MLVSSYTKLILVSPFRYNVDRIPILAAVIPLGFADSSIQVDAHRSSLAAQLAVETGW